MTRVARHRRRFFHWLVSLSLMLAFVVQPALAAVGELHELGHGADETHFALEGGESIAEEIAEHGESGDLAAGVLHIVHHIFHCCGQVTTPAVEAFPPLPPPMHVPGPKASTAARPASEPLLAPFRPPIRG